MASVPLIVTNFFLAMQSGPPGIERLKSLFSEEAEYTEPFSGLPGPHKGPDAIAAAFTSSRTQDFDDVMISLSSVEIDGEIIRVAWTCFSDAIPGGSGSGENVFVVREGKIISLKTTLNQQSPDNAD